MQISQRTFKLTQLENSYYDIFIVGSDDVIIVKYLLLTFLKKITLCIILGEKSQDRVP